MRRFDQKGLAAGSLYMVTGVAAALGSMQYSIGSFWRMGPGFFPLMVSIGLILVGVVVALIAVAPAAPAIPLDRWRLRNLGLITVAVLLFSALIRPGGVILASAAMVAVAGLAARDLRLRDGAISLVVLSVLTWAVFIRLLGLQLTMLPRGFGF